MSAAAKPAKISHQFRSWAKRRSNGETVMFGDPGFRGSTTGHHTEVPSGMHISDASADFHTHAVDWGPDDIGWYSDGAEVVRKATPPDVHIGLAVRTHQSTFPQPWPFNGFMHISGSHQCRNRAGSQRVAHD